MDSLKKRLRKFRSLEELKALASRLFQKNPQVLNDAEILLERFPSERDATSELRHFILRTVTDAIDRKVANLPRHLENYVSFCDLIYVMQRSHDRVWHTIRLKGANHVLLVDQGSQIRGPRFTCSIFSARQHLKKWKKLSINYVQI